MIMTISSYVQGGLGNQMFQYAIARSLAEHYQTDFILDCSWFEAFEKNVTPRALELQKLNTTLLVDQIQKPLTNTKKILTGLQTLLNYGPIIKKQRNAFDFDPSIYHLKNVDKRGLHLYGYWQSFRYYEHIKSILQNEFKPLDPLPDVYRCYEEKILSTESVMVHIRRGDYVHSDSAAKFHGALSMNYYSEAIHLALKISPNVHFFIFSDDLDWAKESLPNNLNLTFIEADEKVKSGPHELYLMTQCTHHIIANSSFSWWGAWLKKENIGNVFAPSRWISDNTQDLSNLLPKNWIQLKA